MLLFYTPDINDNEYVLNEQESRHCVRVLRKQIGDRVHLTNGRGALYKAEIVDNKQRACRLRIVETFLDYQKRNYNLHIAIAPTKNIDRFEWFLEKATEIGVDEITPLICEHSERKVIKPERLEKVIVSAMKQSIKAYKPQLNPLTGFMDFVQNIKLAENEGFIAHCHEGEKQLLKEIYNNEERFCIMIGPEGDFSPQEIGIATSKGVLPISFGESRLRTETAGIIACHSVSFLKS